MKVYRSSNPVLDTFEDATTLPAAREALDLWTTNGTGYYAYQTPTVNDDLCLIPTGTGGVGIRMTDPTAWLHLPAGTTTAGQAPLKFTVGVGLTVAEAGALEFDGTTLLFTPSTTRRRVPLVINSVSTTGSIATWSSTGLLAAGAIVGLAGTKIYWVSDTSGGAQTRKLTFTDGILTAET